jgi:hypothetical protein
MNGGKSDRQVRRSVFTELRLMLKIRSLGGTW